MNEEWMKSDILPVRFLLIDVHICQWCKSGGWFNIAQDVYRKISKRLEDTRSVVADFLATQAFLHPISRLRDFGMSYETTSYAILNRPHDDFV